MNYIKGINAFYIKIETNPLTASATALWHTLMHLNNRVGWANEFSVAAAVVCYKSGLPLSTFKRARNELREKGYIAYTSRGTRAPIYRIISLVEEQEPGVTGEKEESRKRNFGHMGVGNAKSKAIAGGAGNSGIEHRTAGKASFQQVKHERGDKLLVERERYYSANREAEMPNGKSMESLSADTYEFYVDHFGKTPKHVHNELHKWAERMSDAHVLEALKRAVESGHLTWQYTKGILNNWKREQLYTISDVLQAERKFRNKRKRGSRQKPEKTEIIPDWFEESRRMRHESKEEAVVEVGDVERATEAYGFGCRRLEGNRVGVGMGFGHFNFIRGFVCWS